MKTLKDTIVIAALFAACLLVNCSVLGNMTKSNTTIKSFMDNLMKEDYSKCTSMLSTKSDSASLDAVKHKLKSFREMITTNLGTKLKYAYIGTQKNISSKTDTSTPPNVSISYVEISNKKEFGVFKVLLEERTGKIRRISIDGAKREIPNMTYFGLFGLLPIVVLSFNVFMLIKVTRSEVKGKWIKCLIILLLNIPTIGYKASGGLFFKLLSVHSLFGMGFHYGGYSSSSWSLGFPIGSLIVLWILSKMQRQITKVSASNSSSN